MDATTDTKPTATATGRQAIVTRYTGPTNTRGSRVIASCDAGRVTVSWDHALDVAGNHEAACLALVAKLEWSGSWLGGAHDRVYVWVRAEVF
jgi:hypothetical protein